MAATVARNSVDSLDSFTPPFYSMRPPAPNLGVLRHSHQRKLKPDGGAFDRIVQVADAAATPFDRRFTHGQAQADATMHPRIGIVSASEAAEHAAAKIGRHRCLDQSRKNAHGHR